MKTYIVIPSYIIAEGLKTLAINAIKSFRASSDNIVIISVDDGSPMDTVFLKDISDVFIKNEKNSGFAVTCNNGFKWIFKNEKENCYIVCANNDIEVYQGWQESMIEPFSKFENVAITGLISSKSRLIEGNIPIGKYQFKRISEGGLLGDWMQSGGLWMSTKDILQKIGILDERFLRGGYEDIDIFLRARDTFGMKIIMSGLSMFWHKEGATRWNNEFINDFGKESKEMEEDNLKRFIDKWKFSPQDRQVFYEKEVWNP